MSKRRDAVAGGCSFGRNPTRAGRAAGGRGRRAGAGGSPATGDPVTDRWAERNRERRARRKAREAAERRLAELQEAWRRNHPSEEEKRKDRPGWGRPS